MVNSVVRAMVGCSEYNLCFALKLSMKSQQGKISKVTVRDLSDCRGVHVPEKQLTCLLHNQKNNLKSTHNCKDLDIIQNRGHWKGNSKHGYLFE